MRKLPLEERLRLELCTARDRLDILTLFRIPSLDRFSSFYQVLHALLLHSSLLHTCPPHRSFIFAFQVQVRARLARRVAFVAFLSSQTTCKAT